MLRALVSAAMIWIKRGLPIGELRIMEQNRNRAAALAPVFAELKTLSIPVQDDKSSGEYQVFLSFSKKDASAADKVKQALQARRPALRLFDYRRSIDIGKAWQDEIDQAMRAVSRWCRFFPACFASPECRIRRSWPAL